MVIVGLRGGLGNQMFQYAAGRRLAHFLGAELKMDISAFRQDKQRSYALDVFSIQQRFAAEDEVAAITAPELSLFERVILRVKGIHPAPPETYVKERHFHFDPAVLELAGNVYLDGYWQSEKYFGDIKEIIMREFTVKPSQVGKNKELAAIIGDSESVSLHVRRGDYITNPITTQVHGICGLDYYGRAIGFIEKRVPSPHFFIFSDDMEWARANLKLMSGAVTLVDNNSNANAYEDLRLMSQCKHHIIANSSFSWWGAWLNPRVDKLVVAPKRWLRDDQHYDGDVIPVDWLRT